MRSIVKTLGIVTLISVLSSCHKALDPGTTAAVKAANGWWVTFTQGGADVFGLKTFFISTYNTAANNDSLWVDDLGHSWGFKSKVPINFSTLTFSGLNLSNEYAPDSVNISNGKILLKAGRARSGTITDSLYFQVSFSDDSPGLPYIMSGTARTGFAEDDY
jgi:hypothetical protein